MFPGNTNDKMMLLLEAGIAVEVARVALLKLARSAWQGNQAAATALVEATAWLKKVVDLADAIRPEQDQELSGEDVATHAATITDQINNLQAFKFKTNSILTIRGGLDGERSLQIFGLAPITLGKRQWLVLKHLALHAHAHPGAYLSVNEIVNALLDDPTREMAEFWKDVAPEDVHKMIGSLREDIERGGGNPRLIESAKSYGAGYRLSTPCWNVFVEDLDCE